MVIEGVIRPPPEIRAVVEKTALYVAKNGRAFEQRIIGSAKGKTPKFAFLQPTSPFHAYYEQKIHSYEQGGEDKKEDDDEGGNSKDGEEKKQESTTSAKREAAKKSSSNAVIDPVAKALLKQRGKILQARAQFEEEAEKLADKQPQKQQSEDGSTPAPKKKAHYTPPAPPSLELVSIVAPASISIAQVETIQLVAQFTALDGKGGPFLAKLTHREWHNPAFAFCQPRHGHFAYFSALVDAYRRIFDTWTVDGKQVKGEGRHVLDLANNINHCLELAAYRVEYDRDMEEQMRKMQAEDGEISGVAQIDWHDFVVVETIEFPATEVVELSMLPPPPPPKAKSRATDTALSSDLLAAGATKDEMEESDEEEEGETIRVVPSYTPKVVATASNTMDEVIDPITGKSVAVKDMPEHMRIQLLDPKWAEERKKFQEKQKDSNLVGGDVIASNISRFTQARGDMFGKTGHDLLSGETDSKKRLAEANRIIREQAQKPGVGPTLPPPVQHTTVPPPPPPPPPSTPGTDRWPASSTTSPAGEPAAKRPRLETAPDPRLAAIPTDTTTEPIPQPDAEMPGMPPELSLDDDQEKEILPPDEFIKTLSKPEVTLQIRIPNDPSQMAWNFYGQILSLAVDVKSTIKKVKQELSTLHLNGMPPNKIQLKAASGFLKDNATLAKLNIGPSATLEMIPKTRGGRK